MRRDDVTILINCLRNLYGNQYTPYGTFEDEEEGTCFCIEGIDATFSVICFGDTPVGYYDIQIESLLAGDYLYYTELKLDSFLELIERYRLPREQWPALE